MDLLMPILYYRFPRVYHTCNHCDNHFHPLTGRKNKLILYMMVVCALAG
jgi:hypothetical protein